MYDFVFRNGFIMDGTGKGGYLGDLAVQNGKIADIGHVPLGSGREERIVDGEVVAPGFIDTHSHSDVFALTEPELLPKIMQGITTELLGQDGIGPAPLPEDSNLISSWRGYLAGLSGNPQLDWDWRSLEDYARHLEARPTGTNLCMLLPQGNVRMCVSGLEDRVATVNEMKQMVEEVDAGMLAGAFGVSLGMVYMPCIFSTHEEWVRIFARVASYGGFLVVHMRNASSLLLESLDELFRISDEANIPLHVSHFKAAGKSNWHKMTEALHLMEKRSSEGKDVSFDIYPYTAGSTMFTILLPPWSLEGGMSATLQRLKKIEIREAIMHEWESPQPPSMTSKGWDNHVFLNGWENIMISSVRSGNPTVVGRRMNEIAEERGVSTAQAAFDLMEEEQGDIGIIIFSMDEERVAEGIRHPLGMICTDGLLGGKPHPRVYGTFPRILGQFCRERGDLPLEIAVHKMTGKPATRLGLKDRGFLRPGMSADIVTFSSEDVKDMATFENPRQFPQGISHVMVNGVHSVDNGAFTGKLGGKVLRHK